MQACLHDGCAELITYLPKAKSKQGINLLSGQDSSGNQSTHAEQAELAAVPREYISYLKPNLTIAMVDDFTKYPKNGIPPPVSIVIMAALYYIAVMDTLQHTFPSCISNSRHHALSGISPPCQLCIILVLQYCWCLFEAALKGCLLHLLSHNMHPDVEMWHVAICCLYTRATCLSVRG